MTGRGHLWLLAIPFVAIAFPFIYAKSSPAVFGIPFFYWYQILWIAITGIISGVAYLIAERREASE